MTALERALKYTYFNEGGFSNVSADRGGATRYGITRAEASRWRHRPVSIQEMQQFPLEEAQQIYEAWYWKPLACDRLVSVANAIAMFDIGVVRGIGVPPKYAQRVCNLHNADLLVDGHIGLKTITAVNMLPSSLFIKDFAAMAEQGFREIVTHNPSQQVFLKGWVARAQRLLTLI